MKFHRQGHFCTSLRILFGRGLGVVDRHHETQQNVFGVNLHNLLLRSYVITLTVTIVWTKIQQTTKYHQKSHSLSLSLSWRLFCLTKKIGQCSKPLAALALYWLVYRDPYTESLESLHNYFVVTPDKRENQPGLFWTRPLRAGEAGCSM